MKKIFFFPKNYLKTADVFVKKNIGFSDMANQTKIIFSPRSSKVLPFMLGKVYKVHNGRSFKILKVNKTMLGFKLGLYHDTRASSPILPFQKGKNTKNIMKQTGEPIYFSQRGLRKIKVKLVRKRK